MGRDRTMILTKEPNGGIAKRGVAMARICKAQFAGRDSPVSCLAYAESQDWIDTPGVAWVLRAAVNPMTTIGGASLLEVANDFSAYVRPSTLLGRLQGFRKVPLRTRLIRGTGGTTAYWVGETQPKPLSAGAFNSLQLDPLKVVGVAVVTQELLRMSSVDSDSILQDDLRDAVARAADISFMDPANAGTAGVTPPSITYGITPIASTGATVAQIDTDLQAMIKKLTDAGSDLSTAVWVMKPRTATGLATKRGTGGDPAYPGINAKGGELLGLPVLTTPYLTETSGNTFIALVDASQIAIGDEGDAKVEVNTSGSVQMNDAPSDVAASVHISLWQANCAAIKAERFLNWKLLRAEFVAVLSGVAY
jgi:hypothetical protein